MPKKVLTVTDARKNLPSLIKQAAGGRGPIFIGPRGEAVVALVSVDQTSKIITDVMTTACNQTRITSHMRRFAEA